MTHKTGFTFVTLDQALKNAGFARVYGGKYNKYNLTLKIDFILYFIEINHNSNSTKFPININHFYRYNSVV